MTPTNQNSFGTEIGRRLLKAAIAILGLLIIRLLLHNLPMLTHAKPIVVGGIESVMANEMQDWAQWMEEYMKTGQSPHEFQQHSISIILPVSIANAVVDTLIFAVLIGMAMGFERSFRTHVKRLPEGGLMVSLLILTGVVALAYHSYLGVIPPLLGRHAPLYGWFFLTLGLLPVIGLIAVGSRNLDAITEMVFKSGRQFAVGSSQPAALPSGDGAKSLGNGSASASLPGACAKCGGTLAEGVKFCSACGTPVPEPKKAEPVCPSCEAKQDPGARFCEHCGKSLEQQPIVL